MAVFGAAGIQSAYYGLVGLNSAAAKGWRPDCEGFANGRDVRAALVKI
jgi:hypothetical protein